MNVSPIKVTLQKKRWLGDETLKMIVGRNVTTRWWSVLVETVLFNITALALSYTVRDLTRNDHRLYLEEITKDLHMNNFWRWLKSMRRSPRAIPDLHHQGKTLSSLAEKVNTFHSYILSVFTMQWGCREPGIFAQWVVTNDKYRVCWGQVV